MGIEPVAVALPPDEVAVTDRVSEPGLVPVTVMFNVGAAAVVAPDCGDGANTAVRAFTRVVMFPGVLAHEPNRQVRI